MLISLKRHVLAPTSLLAAGLLGMGPALLNPATAQTATTQGSTPAAANNLLGTVTSSSADSLTLKLESGTAATISITPTTRLVRTAPGEKTLKGATAIHLEDLATGDRVLVLHVSPGVEAGHYSAAAVVAMKQADIAQVHASQSEDWQRRGVGGIVKSVDMAPATEAGATTAPAAGGGTSTGPGATIVVGTAQPGRSFSIHVLPATTIRRYAPDSINFADAKPATIGEIHPGDQLRARGDRSADGNDVTAVEIVAGSFRNVAGTITAIDTTQNTLTVTDLSTNKPVTLRLTTETQMRKLPPEMAQRLAARSNAGGAPGAAAGSGGSGGRPAGSAASGTPGATPPNSEGRPGADAGAGQARPRGDAASMLQHAPPVTLAELKKGDAIMVVAARGGGRGVSDAATAITLIAGVEPLLEGSSRGASDSLFSASWNLSGSGGAEGAAQ